VTFNSLFVFSRDRVFGALIDTEEERVGVGLTGAKGFPFCCCETAKDEALGCLKDSQSPSFLIAASMEILVLPTISGSIINPQEPSLRILISDEFDNHLPMLRSPKGFGRFVFQIWDG
jgi:hypothetical protein